MRNFKILFVGFWLAFPSLAAADAGALPGDSAWYFHLDLDRMRKEPASQSLYAWVQGEVFDDLKEDSGVDISEELDQLTAYSTVDQGPVFLFEGDLSQVTEDRIMAMGGSYGGYMANWIGSQTDRFKCLITHASIFSAFCPVKDSHRATATST